MRITFILTSYSRKPIGGFRIVYEYANRLTEKGHQVSIVHPRGIDNIPSPVGFYRRMRTGLGYLVRSILRPHPCWQWIDPRVHMLFVPRPVQRYIPDGDAVIGTFWAIAEHMREYQPSKGVQFYLFQHYETWGGPQERVDAVWKSSLIKVVISTWLLQIGQMLKATDMTLIPNGIDHARFKMHQPIENRPPRVAMMYSNIPWKGSSDGLAAVLFAKQRIPELQAILFGVGDRGSDVPDWIEYRKDPSQDELVEEIYNRAAIFLCSSHTEGFALPPAEAMACGCAVVSTDCGGIRDFSENGTTALLSPPKCPEALGKNLARLLEDDSMRRRIACSGRTRIQKFTWDRSVEALEKLIQMRVDCVAKSKV